MIPAYQIPRNSLAWLLAGYSLSIAPHLMMHLPIWIWAAVAIALIWRVQVFRGIWAFPPKRVRYLLAILGTIGVFLGYHKWTGLEPMVALLVTALTLKLLETHKKRDVLVVIYLAYFVTATLFLLNQAMLMSLYGGAAILCITTALLGLNQSTGHRRPLGSLKIASKLVLQALPLTLILFVMMPRLGSLWSVPSPQNSAKTGMSDSMSPGDFTKLGRSGELAFRATFDGAIPPADQLYWRGLIFSRFDGRTWQQASIADYTRNGESIVRWSGEPEAQWEQQVVRKGAATGYEVILESTQQIYLFALPMAASSTRGVGFTRDYRLVQEKPVNKRSRYRVTSHLDYQAELTLPDWRKLDETRLPAGFNPKTIALARSLRDQFGSPQALMSHFLQMINREFIYSLEPPALGKDSVDEFIFGSKTGFCEHFASSFVVFMRAAGVPARVVVGYQGGEVNDYDNYLLVHQFDAHAWAEVWLEGQGWVRVDPTSAVAPERVESSVSELSGADTPLALVNFKSVPLLNWVRLQSDRLDYAWHRYVLGYDSRLQSEVLTRLLGGKDVMRLGLFMAGTAALFLIGLALKLRWQGRDLSERPAVRSYRCFCQKLAGIGLAREVGETPTDYALRVAVARPDLAQAVSDITQLFVALVYKPALSGLEDEILWRRIKSFKPSNGA